MLKDNKWLYGAIGVLILIMVYVLVRPERVVVETTIKRDTTYVNRIVKVPEYKDPTIQYLPYEIHDTTKITRYIKDSVQVAVADSIFDKDKNFVLYKLQYWYPPVNKFTFGDVKIKGKEITIEKTNTIFVEPPTFSFGLGFGVQYGILNKQFDFGPNVGVNLRITF